MTIPLVLVTCNHGDPDERWGRFLIARLAQQPANGSSVQSWSVNHLHESRATAPNAMDSLRPVVKYKRGRRVEVSRNLGAYRTSSVSTDPDAERLTLVCPRPECPTELHLSLELRNRVFTKLHVAGFDTIDLRALERQLPLLSK